LHVTNCNGQDLTIKKIIDMITLGCPLLHTFAMMEHQPQSCQIPS
jgi:hypothetical protein